MNSTTAAALAVGAQVAAAARAWMLPGEILIAYGRADDLAVTQETTTRGPADAYQRAARVFAHAAPYTQVRIWFITADGVIRHQAAGPANQVRRTVARWSRPRIARPRFTRADVVAHARAALRAALRPALLACVALALLGVGFLAGLATGPAHTVTATGMPAGPVVSAPIGHRGPGSCVMLCADHTDNATQTPASAAPPAPAAWPVAADPGACELICAQAPPPTGAAAAVSFLLDTFK